MGKGWTVDLDRRKPATQDRLRPQAGYHFTSDKMKRSAPTTTIKSEDDTLTRTGRKQAKAVTLDQMRNFALVGWMIRKHLDFVTEFTFQAVTKDQGFNKDLEAFIERISTAGRFDAAGRHNRQAFASLVETAAVLAGDIFTLKLRRGQVQGIEGDRVYNFSDMPPEMKTRRDGKLRNWIHGVECTAAGRAINYAVGKRDGSRVVFDRVVRAGSIIPHGYYQRFDQIRGVSPIVASLNSNQDLYESFDYQLIQQKVRSLIAFTINSQSGAGLGSFDVTATDAVGSETDDGDGNLTHETSEHTIKPGVASVLRLDPDEELKAVESHSPSQEAQSFHDTTIKLSLLSLDIPWLFYAALQGSYSVHRSVTIHYEKSCKPKRARMKTWHDNWTLWRLLLAIEAGEFALPRGMTIDDVLWEWQADGIPWHDALKEVKAAHEEVAGGFNSPQRICKARGRNFRDVVDEIAEAIGYAKEKGVPLSWATLDDPALAAAIMEGADDDA